MAPLILSRRVSWVGGMIFFCRLCWCRCSSANRSRHRRRCSSDHRPSDSGRWVWGAIAVLLFTGTLLLHQRGLPIADPLGWPMVLGVKLGLVAILLILTLTHDLIIGPRVVKILQLPTESRTRLDHALVVWSPWIARCSLFLALAVLFAAVMLART